MRDQESDAVRTLVFALIVFTTSTEANRRKIADAYFEARDASGLSANANASKFSRERHLHKRHRELVGQYNIATFGWIIAESQDRLTRLRFPIKEDAPGLFFKVISELSRVRTQ